MWQVVVSVFVCVCVSDCLLISLTVDPWSSLSLIVYAFVSVCNEHIHCVLKCSSFSFVWAVSLEVSSLTLLPLSNLLSVCDDCGLSIIS